MSSNLLLSTINFTVYLSDKTSSSSLFKYSNLTFIGTPSSLEGFFIFIK